LTAGPLQQSERSSKSRQVKAILHTIGARGRLHLCSDPDALHNASMGLRKLTSCAVLALAIGCSSSDGPSGIDDDDQASDDDAVSADDDDDDAPARPAADAGKPTADARVLDGSTKPTPDAALRSDASSTSPPSSNDAGPPLVRGDGATTPVRTDAGEPSRGDGGEASGSDAGTSPEPNGLRPKCVKKPSQVMVIGDSYINWITHTFPQDMAKEAGQTWRMEAIGAYSMGSGGAGFIPDQYKSSIARDPDCHTILMDGGGNDLLVADPSIDFAGQCKTEQAPMLKQCQTIIDKAIAAADALLLKASADGVRDVVYFFYPHVPKNTLLGGPNPNAMLDHALPQVRKFCEGVEEKTSGKTRCTFVDMVPVFEGHDDWFVPGDIHENSQGSAAMAKELWKVMKDRCIAQPEASGCCEP
jgi:hypothetical protein